MMKNGCDWLEIQSTESFQRKQIRHQFKIDLSLRQRMKRVVIKSVAEINKKGEPNTRMVFAHAAWTLSSFSWYPTENR